MSDQDKLFEEMKQLNSDFRFIIQHFNKFESSLEEVIRREVSKILSEPD